MPLYQGKKVTVVRQAKQGDKDFDPATPKSVVTTLPDALNVDVQQLGRICTNAAFAARSCPATTRVGSRPGRASSPSRAGGRSSSPACRGRAPHWWSRR